MPRQDFSFGRFRPERLTGFPDTAQAGGRRILRHARVRIVRYSLDQHGLDQVTGEPALQAEFGHDQCDPAVMIGDLIQPDGLGRITQPSLDTRYASLPAVLTRNFAFPHRTQSAHGADFPSVPLVLGRFFPLLLPVGAYIGRFKGPSEFLASLLPLVRQNSSELRRGRVASALSYDDAGG